jgi:hypothetical protein
VALVGGIEMKIGTRIVLSSLLYVVCLTVGAAQQRMALPPGSIQIDGEAVHAIRAYCVDISRPTPTPSTSFSHVLTHPDSAVVRINGKTMSLSEAINNGLVSVTGASASLEEVIDFLSDPRVVGRMPAKTKRDTRRLASAWKNANKAEREDLEREFAPLVADVGNHTSLAFHNLTNDSISIEIREPVVMSAFNESVEDVNLGDIKAPEDRREQRLIQSRLWLQGTAIQQRNLKILGYYNGPITGEMGVSTKAGIVKFQKDHGIKPSGVLDASTLTTTRTLTVKVLESDIDALTKTVNDIYSRPENGKIHSLVPPSMKIGMPSNVTVEIMGALFLDPSTQISVNDPNLGNHQFYSHFNRHVGFSGS